MSNTLEQQMVPFLDALLPGNDVWPKYSDADTASYWQGWEQRTHTVTRWGLLGCLWMMRGYCRLHLWLHGSGHDLAEILSEAEHSNSYAIRQAVAMLKSIGCLAYFSDPMVFELGMSSQKGDS